MVPTDNTYQFKQIVKDKIHREGINSLMEWLETSDFYEAPSSTKYHGAFPGGLVKHSLRVYEQLKNKQENESDESIAIVALFHDLCKVNFYKSKSYVTPEGILKTSYTVDDDFPAGHGEKSVFLLLRFLSLSDEEILAIRWHMGAYSTQNSGEVQAMSSSLKRYRLVLKLQQADSEAAFFFNE